MLQLTSNLMKNKKLKDLSPFAAVLLARIRYKIRELRADGVVAMGLANLEMVARPCVADLALAGAPWGTNAAYYAHEIFADLCETPDVAKFILPPRN